MNKSKSLSGTPWHIDILKKAEDDDRRHKSRCKYYDEGTCFKNFINCRSSVHCSDYVEKEKIDIIKVSKKNNQKNEYQTTVKNIVTHHTYQKRETQVRPKSIVILKDIDTQKIYFYNIENKKIKELNNIIFKTKKENKKVNLEKYKKQYFLIKINSPIASMILGKYLGDRIHIKDNQLGNYNFEIIGINIDIYKE